jgi:putative cell wall-binding protein
LIKFKRILSLISFTLLTITISYCLVNSSEPVMAASNISNDRLSGNDRYATSASISKTGWKTTSYYAVIATGDNFPDALCAAPLAKKYAAPILLTNTNSLNYNTKAELQRLKVKTVIIVGGTGVVSQGTENQIKALGINTSRVAGKNRYGTSAKVAAQIGTSNDVVIAIGDNFPDALSIAPIAAKEGMPILLTEKNSIPSEIKSYLNSKKFTKSYVLGGTGVISGKVVSELENPKRLSGNNRYDTNIAVLNEFSSDLNLSKIYVATGANFPDALSCSALSPISSSPLILIESNITDSTKAYISNNFNSINNITTVGGLGVVSEYNIQNIKYNFKARTNFNGNFIAKGKIVKDNLRNLSINKSGFVYDTNKFSSLMKAVNNNGPQEYNCENVCVLGDSVYFTSNAKLYKSKVDGSEGAVCVSNLTMLDLNILGDYAYFRGWDNRLYRAKINEGSIESNDATVIKLSDDIPSNINIEEDWIYYTDQLYSLWRIKIDGSLHEKMTGSSTLIFSVILNNGQIYYIGNDVNSYQVRDCRIYRMDLNGHNKVQLTNNEVLSFNMDSKYIIYSTLKGINRMNFDSTGETKLASYPTYKITVTGDYVYFKPSDFDSAQVYRVKMDGSNLQAVQEQ